MHLQKHSQSACDYKALALANSSHAGTQRRLLLRSTGANQTLTNQHGMLGYLAQSGGSEGRIATCLTHAFLAGFDRSLCQADLGTVCVLRPVSSHSCLPEQSVLDLLSNHGGGAFERQDSGRGRPVPEQAARLELLSRVSCVEEAPWCRRPLPTCCNVGGRAQKHMEPWSLVF